MARRQQKPVRLSETLRAFNAELLTLSDEDRAKVIDALPECFRPAEPAARKLAGGAVVKRFEVNLVPMIQATPSDLRGSARDVSAALQGECIYRGEDWALEGAHLAVREFITGKAA